MMISAEILTIGDEVVRGDILNTHSKNISNDLTSHGIHVRWHTSCLDRQEDIVEAITRATGRVDLLLVTGGLGPTVDDLTVDTVSNLLSCEPAESPPALAKLKDFQKKRGREVSASQRRQVRFPSAATPIDNSVGFAPGFYCYLNEAFCVFLPGVPREMLKMMTYVRDEILQRQFPTLVPLGGMSFRTFGKTESQLNDELMSLALPENIQIQFQLDFPEVLIRTYSHDQESLFSAAEVIEKQLGDTLLGSALLDLPFVVYQLLREQSKTVAVAESCTAGLLGCTLTQYPGSSAFFLGGALVYTNEEKTRQLGVSPETLTAHGAVSKEVVLEMAVGARERFGADYGVSISGIAGPDGGNPEKPVGTVWIGVAGPTHESTFHFCFPGKRRQIRKLAVWWALARLRAMLQTSQ